MFGAIFGGGKGAGVGSIIGGAGGLGTTAVDRVFGVGARGFAAKTSREFAGTALPYVLVYAFLMFLPFAEVVLGALLVFGLLTRWTLALGGLLIAVLVFGTALRSDWSTAGVHMVYAITNYFLLKNLADNYFSLDTLLPAYRKPLAIRSTGLSGERA